MTVLLVADPGALPPGGWLFDDVAIFGMAPYLNPNTCAKAWNARLMTSMVTAKASLYDVTETWCLDADCWWDVAALTSAGETLVRMRPGIVAAELCTATLGLARLLASRLPHPPRSLLGRPVVPPQSYPAVVADVASATSTLAQVLADEGWTDPDALAGWVHEVTLALTACAQWLLRGSLGAQTLPTRRLTRHGPHPTRCVRA